MKHSVKLALFFALKVTKQAIVQPIKKQALVVLAHQLDDTLSASTDLSVKKRHLLDNLRRRLIIKWQRLDG